MTSTRKPKGPPARSKRAPERHAGPLREQVAAALDWSNAHVSFDAAIAGIPANLRGRQPEGLPYSLWQLLEHLRICQRDILDYCVNPQYREGAWPDDYWPRAPAPPTPQAWDQSLAAFKADLAELKRIATDPTIELVDKLPYAPQATYLRELLLVADHNAYHLGQIVAVRRLLGNWKA